MPLLTFDRNYTDGRGKPEKEYIKIMNFRCHTSQSTCDEDQRHIEQNLHKEVFILPNETNHYDLVPAMRKINGFVKYINEGVKSGRIQKLLMNKAHTQKWREPVYNKEEAHQNLVITINCNTIISDKMQRAANAEYNRPHQITIMLGQNFLADVMPFNLNL